MPVPTLTPAFIIPEGIGGGISGGGGNVGATAAGVVAAGVIAGGLAVVAAPVVAGVAAKASLLTAASPLGLLAVGTFLKGLQQLREWGLFNHRPEAGSEGTVKGDVLGPNDEINRQTWVVYKNVDKYVNYQLGNGPVVNSTTKSEELLINGGMTVGLEIGDLLSTKTFTNDPGAVVSPPSVCRFHKIQAGNFRTCYISTTGDSTEFSSTQSGTFISGVELVRVNIGGTDYFPEPEVVGSSEFAPGTRPQLFPPTLPDAPVLPRPARDPVPLTPALPPPPDRRPLAPPVVIPRPGQQPARVPVPGPSPGPSPGPGPAPVPAQPAPLQVPGIGPLPLPAPLPVPVTPVEVVVVDGLPISGPGQAPAPNLVAIAQELGRLEKKNEILMRRPENGGLGEAAENSLLNGLRELLEGLVGELLNDVGGGSFQLIRPCRAPGGGDPLPPVVVPYSGGTNATMAVLAKLDGIAGLIQAHKDVGQPTCVTPVFGEEVTVHFESE